MAPPSPLKHHFETWRSLFLWNFLAWWEDDGICLLYFGQMSHIFDSTPVFCSTIQAVHTICIFHQLDFPNHAQPCWQYSIASTATVDVVGEGKMLWSWGGGYGRWWHWQWWLSGSNRLWLMPSETRGYHCLPHKICIPSSLHSEKDAEGMARVWLEATVAVHSRRGSQIRVPLVFGHH